MTQASRTKLAAEAINKHRAGDHITDEELRAACHVLPTIIEFLRLCGDRYALVKIDLIQHLSQFEGYVASRKRDKQRVRPALPRIDDKN